MIAHGTVHRALARRSLRALAAFLVLFSSAGAARAQEADSSWAPEAVGESIIPKAVFEKLLAFKVKKYRPIRGIDFNQEGGDQPMALESLTFVQTTLRGQLALIPVIRSRYIPLTDRVAALAFPIYLCAKCGKKGVPESLFVSDQQNLEAPPGTGTKLLQVVFYDRVQNKELGKPEGFPLEWSRWDRREKGGQDWDRILEPVAQPIPVRDCPTCIALNIPREADGELQGYLYAFAYVSGKALVSKPFIEGYVRFSNHAEDPNVQVTLNDLHRDPRGILAHRESRSNLKAPLLGIPPGKIEEDVVLLSLPNDGT